MTHTPDDREVLATAYILGHATPEQVAEFRRLEAEDAGFRELVTELESWLAPLGEEVEEIPPPAHVLDNIMTEIGAPKSNALVTPPSPTVQQLPLRTLGAWRTAAIAASLIAVVSVSALFFQASDSAEPSSQLIALLGSADEPGAVAIVFRPDTGQLTADITAISLPDNAVWQLWRIRDGDPLPISLGLLDNLSTEARLSLTLDRGAISPNDLIAISLEPLGGSQQQGPSGTILFSEKVRSL